jgi:hypothetical protein
MVIKTILLVELLVIMRWIGQSWDMNIFSPGE